MLPFLASDASSAGMSSRKSDSFGTGVGVHGGTWGSAQYKNHPWLPTAQVIAA
eukprot:CAMPEP_0179196090 /NCGR_PEP_ID=MMETSP0796-20121207/97493_1 /TAXON_ID=73915 /ORGANISM="Pyrodinium bahamense, Strain pbaha01" /LENGTH=52 /DNA_ID=CAMNT_0020900475 /DNA_START=1 /DNA_END=156 /DNA_ORIENTATION=+